MKDKNFNQSSQKKDTKNPDDALEQTILIVDDDEAVRDVLKKILERRGFSAITATNGEEGLAQVMNNKIQIVFCDIMMPKVDGLEFLKRVRDYNSAVEVIMITGQSTLDNCVESVERGACAFLIKPFNIQEIFNAIARAKRNINEKKKMIKKVLEHGDTK